MDDMNENDRLNQVENGTQWIPKESDRAGEGTDLAAILEAWHAATLRLEQTHEALQAEVRRLTAELEKKNRELARKDRLADLGRMAAHIAHELRNSLVPVSLYVSLLKRRVTNAESVEIIEKIEQAVQGAQSVLNDMLQFAADREVQETLFELKPWLTNITKEIELQAVSQKVLVKVEVPELLLAWADRDLLRRAIINLLLNALDAMPSGGEVTVRAAAAGRDLVISVADTGPGLSEEALQHAFEPFFTTKANGTGLGLAIVEHLVQLHGGTITVQNGRHGGAVFQIHLPNRCVIPTQMGRQAA
ncbi:MAG: HAMP domain-containing histidine kinase [Thermogutta sp.]|uniref:sensor histidine kinase n=1 Tax=Thermogutta sp. TaxID=1962930 RepID=UPI00199EEEEF|nr:HAMP domain-containing sensor histidine kinase [Thermogutta sp.]MBC7352974.1 HAMP domain-containing histidine kinase [Thermogutta sp.]